MENLNQNQEEEQLPRLTKRGLGARPILESQILAVQETAQSAAECARMLRINYKTYKKYAELYGIFDKVKNPTGKGLKRAHFIRNRKYNIEELIKGGHLKYPLIKFKKKLFDSGYIPCVCGSCGFSEARISDGKYPLMLDFIDGDINNRKIENIRPLCYNCFFLCVGSRNQKKWYTIAGMSEKQVIEMNKQKYANDLYKS